jgi:hypothetical protein
MLNAYTPMVISSRFLPNHGLPFFEWQMAFGANWVCNSNHLRAEDPGALSEKGNALVIGNQNPITHHSASGSHIGSVVGSSSRRLKIFTGR